MVQPDLHRDSSAGTPALRDRYVQAFRWMLLARILDEPVADCRPDIQVEHERDEGDHPEDNWPEEEAEKCEHVVRVTLK